jgi:Cu2+-exporting ATPase
MKTIQLKVDGMSCEHCVKHVTEALSGVPGVAGAEVSLQAGTATVTAGDDVADRALLEAVEEAGYDAAVA